MNTLKIFFVILLCLCVQEGIAQKILSLEESKQLALENNAKSKNSKLEIEASQQIRKSALTNYFPTISAGGMMWGAQKNLMEIQTQGGDLPVYDGNPANLTGATQFAYFPSSTMGLMKKGTVGFVNAIQPVFAGGRIYNGNRLAALGVEVSEYKDKMTKDEILLKTEEQYRQIVCLEEKVKTIDSYEALLRNLSGQVEDAFKSGLVLKNDVLKVNLKLSEVWLNKTKLENGRKLALMAFCQYTGIPYDSALVLKDSLKIDEIPMSVRVDKDEAVKNRSEYALLQKSVEAEKLQSRMKLGEYLPQAAVGLSGMYMKFDDAKERTLGLLFGTVSVPISGWWGGSHELQERKIKENIAENNFRNNAELLALQIEKSWQDLTTAYKQYLLSEESKVQAEENYKVNADSYKNGITKLSDLLESQALLQQTRDQLTDAKTDYLNKKSTYLKVTGR